jgi:hypothetical protein
MLGSVFVKAFSPLDGVTIATTEEVLYIMFACIYIHTYVYIYTNIYVYIYAYKNIYGYIL